MTRRSRAFVLAIACVSLASIVGLPASPAAASHGRGPIHLASGELRRAVRAQTAGRPVSRALDVRGNDVRVEVLAGQGGGLEQAVRSVGGTIEGRVADQLIEALVPINRLEELEASPGVAYVRPPLEVNSTPFSDAASSTQLAASPVVGEEIAKTNADAWQAAGFTGTGVRVGIVDSFSQSAWDTAQAAGDVPAPAGTFCRPQPCTVWKDNNPHGVGVAEVIHEMAPDAPLFLASVSSTAQLQEAVDWFASNGVQIINKSSTAYYDGPGDGTGPIDSVVDDAVNQGMVWFNAAGNNAGTSAKHGSYWRGPWTDGDANGWLDFAFGDERLSFACYFINGLRWSDFGSANPTDYDLYIFDNVDDTVPIVTSTDRQSNGALPIESPKQPCSSPLDIDYLGVKLVSPGNGTGGDTLEFMTNGTPLEYFQNPYSASGPIADSANPGEISVGAIDPPNGTDIAEYSARGPTNDQRVKPDLSASAGMLNRSVGPRFQGTSAASPTAAGAAALAISAGVAATPETIKSWLLSNAVVDRGAVGTDNKFGAGELILPAPPVCTKTWANAANGLWSTPGNWSPAGVPTSTDNVCVKAGGTYAVTLRGSQQARSVTIGGPSGTQSLRLVGGCNDGAASFTSTSHVLTLPRGAIVMTSDGCSGGSTLSASGNAIVNRGALTVDQGAGGSRTIDGTLSNLGAATIDAPVTIQHGALNQGSMIIDDGVTLSSSGTFTNKATGSITETGTGRIVESNGSFNHNGTLSGPGVFNVELAGSNLNITSTAAGRFLWHGSGNLTGDVSAAQQLNIEGDCSSGSASATVPGNPWDPASRNISNGGTIVLTSACAATASLNLGQGTVTNSGTFRSAIGSGGARQLNGSILNEGDLAVDQPISIGGKVTNTAAAVANADVDVNAGWQNQGTLSIGDTASVAVSGTFTNAVAGTIAESGDGLVVVRNGTFVHSGTIMGPSGYQVELRGSNLDLSGSKDGRFLWHGSAALTGNISAGQELFIEGDCSSGTATANVSGNMTNTGKIWLTSSCPAGATLNLGSNTLTNAGLLLLTKGAGGGPRSVQGNLINNNLVSVDAGIAGQISGSFTQTFGGTYSVGVDSLTAFGSVATGTSSLTGRLTVVRRPGFRPSIGKSLDILTGSSVAGAWSRVAGAVIKGPKYFLPVTGGTAATLVVRIATLSPQPTSGHAGSTITLNGASLPPNDTIKLSFKDAANKVTTLGTVTSAGDGSFSKVVTIPAGAALGTGRVMAQGTLVQVKVSKAFAVN